MRERVPRSRGERLPALLFVLFLLLPRLSHSASLDCSAVGDLKSGVPVKGDTTGGVSNVDSYPCTWRVESGPEAVYKITTTTTGDLVAKVAPAGAADLDVFILGACDETACAAYGDKEAILAAAVPGTYYIVVEGYAGAEGQYTLAVTGLCEGVDCDDGDSCTQDTCDPGTGLCTHTPLCPEVTSLSPAQGDAGDTVIVSGARFTSGIPPAVSFSGVPAAVVIWSATSISCKVPAGASTGCVTVTNEFGTSACIEP